MHLKPFQNIDDLGVRPRLYVLYSYHEDFHVV